MNLRSWCAAPAFGLALFAAAGGAQAGQTSRLSVDSHDRIEAEIRAMRAEYEARIAALEARVKAAEDAAAAARQPAAGVQVATDPDQAQVAAQTAPAGEAAPSAAPEPGAEEVQIASDPTPKVAPASLSNPGVSVVLNGNYVMSRRDPDLARIPGFPQAEEAGPPVRGLSLGESEITLAANVDPFLSAALTASIDREGGIGVEEAYIQTTALPGGLTARAGRFFSGVGYLNERHAHNWNFIDMPLPYRAFLGGQYGDDGVQARWLAPLPIFVEVGAELYRGDSFPAAGARNRGVGTQTLYVHAGGDFDASSSWLAGLSWLRAEARDREVDGDLFSGRTDILIASAVYKWAPNGNLVDRNFAAAAELFQSRRRGDLNGVRADGDDWGWYVQGVYQYARGWSAGLRYAELDPGDVAPLLLGTSLDPMGRTPRALSALIEHDTSEFGRIRLQYSRDMSDQRDNDQVWIQYTVLYGPHAAHRF